MLASTSLNISAQEVSENSVEVTDKKAEEQIEVIEVTGLRGSLKKSINDKRFATNVVDTINAEDVGKSTDQNVADALGRVTGVTVVSQDGEGSQITVRGASSNQNRITINGQQMTSTDFSQAVDLSSFSADILSKLEVVKTPSANHDEGSLGASVNLTTVRPLYQDKDVRTATFQGRYNDFSEEGDYKISAAVSEKFLDETFGVALSLYNETNGVAIPPTPAVGGVGLIPDLEYMATLTGAKEGDTLILIGETQGWLGSSIYLREILRREEGAPPPVDLEIEKRNGDYVRKLIRNKRVNAVHDCSDGGLAITACEMAFAGNIGMHLTRAIGCPTHAWLFGEDQARYLVAVEENSVNPVISTAKAKGVAAQVVGKVGGDRIKADGGFDVTLAGLREKHEAFLPELMA